ncbi:MAG: GTPase ObgE [Candidatus Obscuribacter phosphatis]|uniref:GTPase Obg n=1 Tax=Candidatus Obscuribacter phosphatis TaxID=1906157 RepID=A0A8J7P7K7_9BACT|nr:GTPase ObgE [Candidatus Obscuribacter phosphatis]
MAQFIDQVEIEIQSGDGGNGSINWRREKYEPMGGPAGGNGGRGGSVYIEATSDLNTLLDFRFKNKFLAEPGQKGGPKNRHGKAGPDVIIRVPVGTQVRDVDLDKEIADLTEAGEKVLVAEGGMGGRGNTELASSTRRAPHFCEPGQPGVQRRLQLTLKLLADVGIIGLPNAGKSTLLSALTRAKPKIADYPFSTLEPNLGVARTESGDGFVLADIPGLIEGASQGVGLGHNFLRHIERTRLLVHMVDGQSEDLEKDLATIDRELMLYSPDLAKLPQLVAINKCDMLPPETIDELKAKVTAYFEAKEEHAGSRGSSEANIFCISAYSHIGLAPLAKTIADMIEQIKEAEKQDKQPKRIFVDEKAYDHGDSSFAVYRKSGVFVVEGDRAGRLVQVTDMKDPDSLFSLFQRLRAMGVIDALINEGVTPGAEVVINGFSFTYGEGLN